MNKKYSIGLVGLLLLATSGSVAAQSSTTITVTGSVTPGTCSVAAVPVTIDPVRLDQLLLVSSGGEVTDSRKPFNIAFTGCSGVSNVDMRFTGTAVATNFFANATGTGRATNVAVQLNRVSGTTHTRIIPGGTHSAAISGVGHTQNMSVALARPNATAPTVGTVQTQITVNLTYR